MIHGNAMLRKRNEKIYIIVATTVVCALYNDMFGSSAQYNH